MSQSIPWYTIGLLLLVYNDQRIPVHNRSAISLLWKYPVVPCQFPISQEMEGTTQLDTQFIPFCSWNVSKYSVIHYRSVALGLQRSTHSSTQSIGYFSIMEVPRGTLSISYFSRDGRNHPAWETLFLFAREIPWTTQTDIPLIFYWYKDATNSVVRHPIYFLLSIKCQKPHPKWDPSFFPFCFAFEYPI